MSICNLNFNDQYDFVSDYFLAKMVVVVNLVEI